MSVTLVFVVVFFIAVVGMVVGDCGTTNVVFFLVMLVLLLLFPLFLLILLLASQPCAQHLFSTLTLLRFSHVVSRIGKLENIDRTYFLITATDFYHNQVRIE